jgi:hypothetical protein
MGLLGMLIREVITLGSELKSKNKLEKQLGRKVEKRDIYSLGANLEAAEANAPPNPQFQFAAPPMAPQQQTFPPAAKSKTKFIILGIIGIAAVLLFVFGIAALYVMMLSENDYNRLNPFTPKPPAGAFPASIAEYNRSDEINYSRSYSQICSCSYFSSTYRKGDHNVNYTFYKFKTEAEAKSYLNRKDFIGGTKRMEQVSDSRFVAIDKERGSAVIALTAATNLIVISANKPNEAIAFENALPFSAFGAAQPPTRIADGLEDTAVQTTTLIEEFKRDKTAAKTKYDGKTFLLTGTVIVTNADQKDKPYLGFQIPNTKPTLETMIVCSFTPAESSKVANTKTGTIVRFRGKVKVNTELIDIVTVEDCRFEPDK